jgi:predicted N-acetyltransferase YhbS
MAAEAMPYHRHRRAECNTAVGRFGVAGERDLRTHRPRRHGGSKRLVPWVLGPCDRDARQSSIGGASSRGNELVSVEYLIRAARITDVDRLVALSHESLRASGGRGPLIAADLLRQLVYLPQASILVAEEGRELVGGAVLALRPSVRAGGYVGTVDLLLVDPRHDVDRVTEALLEELLRSARNKGCTVVEAVRPEDPGELGRWNRLGFTGGEPSLQRPVADRAAAPR